MFCEFSGPDDVIFPSDSNPVWIEARTLFSSHVENLRPPVKLSELGKKVILWCDEQLSIDPYSRSFAIRDNIVYSGDETRMTVCIKSNEWIF